MIEELQQLEENAMITIDSDSSKNLTGLEDFVVDYVYSYNCDDTEIVMISLGEYFLIASNISGENKYAICENYDDADEYIEDEAFLEVIEISGGENVDQYQQIAAIYTCDNEDTNFCEYSSDSDFNYAMIYADKDKTELYRGVEIDEDQIIL